MTITVDTRLCSLCRAFLPAPTEPQVCAKCGHLAVPIHHEWPKGLKRWLAQQLLLHFFAPHMRASEHYRWERLLIAVMSGRTWRGHSLPYASSASDCFIVALRQFNHEQAAAPALTLERKSHVA